ncbi:MAG: prepilin-type N-terminal cleavage/methylation domain-containing protein [Campylobacterota bacterium]|nr:prepilin-type N-terminal cleavage/methylation domain-containing protein [Campylobacterota bacterium]
MKQKAFTLFEIIITIILISIFYLFAINSFSNSSKIDGDVITLNNLKQELLKVDFEEEINIQCNNQDLSCLVFVDGVLDEDEEGKIENLFLKEPIVYKYNKNLEDIEFQDLELEQLERQNIVFKYSCKKNRKCDEMIVQTEDKVYVFNDIHNKPITLNYIDEVSDFFDDKIGEIKDAF